MNRETQSVLLAFIGSAIVRIAVDDTFLRYVREWTRPGLLLAGALLILLGLVSLWRERGLRGAESDEHVVGAVHEHSQGPWVAWLLVLPVLTMLLVAPPALGSYTAARSAATVAKPADREFMPLRSGDPVTISLTEYATRAIWDDGRSLTGRRIRMVGFVSTRPAGGFYLTRIAITCCAADARAVRIAVPGAASGFSQDTWVAVTGRYGGMDPTTDAKEKLPVIRAESIMRVPAPVEPYES